VQIYGTEGADTINVLDALAPAVDFRDQVLLTYDGIGQETPDSSEILNEGSTLRLSGNIWRAIDFSYDVTPNTILEFDFSSSIQGEIHGIGFDNNLSLTSGYTFQVHGTQSWGIQDNNNYDPASGTQRYRIPVGQSYTGDFNYLFFANDDDVNPTGESLFSNVRVYEAPTAIYVRTGAGNDQVQGDSLTNVPTYLFGGEGDDTLQGNAGVNWFYGQAGNDTYIVPPKSPDLDINNPWDAIQYLYESEGDDTYVFEPGLKGISLILADLDLAPGWH